MGASWISHGILAMICVAFPPLDPNMYLSVKKEGTASWAFRWRDPKLPPPRNSRVIGLGPLHTVSLDQARVKAAEYRRMLVDGKDNTRSVDIAGDSAVVALIFAAARSVLDWSF
jgi:hypothetical protein